MKDTSFYFNGRLYRAPENLTVAEALIHNNKFIFGRSIRYHRARSYFCGKGLCSHCMVSIDGIGNVRSCITPLKEGMKIDSQNYLLSVNFDPLRFIDYVFNPYFNYARTKLTRSFMAPLFNYAMRKIAGTEILPEKVTIKKSEKLEVHVLVIGAGKYGTETAIVSSEFGAKVALIDTVPDIRYDDRAMPYINKGTLKIYPYTSAIYLSKTDTGWITGLFTRDRTYIEVNSHAVVIATGTEPSLPLFGNNDLPGIMTHSAFEKLIDKGVDINGRVAVEIHNKIPYSIMEKLKKRRINTVFIKNDEINAELSGYGEVVVGNIKYAYGGSRIAGIVTDRNDKIKAAMVAVDDRDHRATELLFQTGCRMKYDGRGFYPEINEYLECTVPALFVAGDVAGNLVDPLKAAKIAGINSAIVSAKVPYDMRKYESGYTDHSEIRINNKVDDTKQKIFVCSCEDVVYKELEDMVKNGYDTLEKIKRYGGIGTGVCQGKLCLLNTKTTLKDNTVNITTQRPPLMPIKMGSLAGDADEKI